MSDTDDTTDSHTGHSSQVGCGSCGWQVAEPKRWLHDPEAQRQPCPRCGAEGAWLAETTFTDIAKLREFIGLKGKEPGKKKPILELQAGDQVEQSTGRWMKKYRLIERDQDMYEEIVTDAETGELRHVCREPLNEHWGHGTAKLKGGVSQQPPEADAEGAI
jgi:hypothetical protein